MDFENNNLSLRIDFWNISGLQEEKSENDIYQKYINKFNIIYLSETWKCVIIRNAKERLHCR